ncbi:MAG: bifunctional sulfate adenylyltransferase/adenylylsulfate kinase [Thermodesulfobacteriota bacterium]
MGHLVEPHGGRLVNLLVDAEEQARLKAESVDFPSIDLNQRQLCDLELLATGAFSPLTGYMDRATCQRVLTESRLPDGLVWPLPVCLDVSAATARELAPGTRVALRDLEGFMLAVLTVTEVWQPDKRAEARLVFGTDDMTHPGVAALLTEHGDWYVAGAVAGLQLPIHYDYKLLRLTPAETRAYFQKLGWRRVLAFDTTKPLHNAHKEITLVAAREHNAHIFLQPIVGLTHPGDIDHYARVRCYDAIVGTYPPGSVLLGLIPLARRRAGPREALWHALIRKNYGCSHFMVAADHADPHAVSDQPRHYPRGAALAHIRQFQEEIGVQPVPLRPMVFLPARAQYVPVDEISEDDHPLEALAAGELRRRLTHGLDIPAWFSPPAVVEVLRRAYPPRSRQGFTVFMTGLSGSGKSTIARVLLTRFMELGERPVTLLDGDVVRKNLSSELGFSRRDRNLNITRIGFVASEITKNGGIALCAPIAPYRESRRENRRLISQYGGYIEVHVATPLAVCEGRDRKGLYAKARAGIVRGLTGIDDPYELPESPEVRIDTSENTPDEAAEEVLLYLRREGYIR